MPDGLATAQGYVVGILGAAEKEQVAKDLTGQTVRLAALAARKFADHQPDARGALPLGLVAYQGCAVYVLAQAFPESIFGREPDDSIMGRRIWVSKGTQSDAPESETYVLTLLAPETLLACNDREFFTEVVSRMSAPQNSRALPATLPEWKLVDRSAPVWGIRHFGGNGDGTHIFDISALLDVKDLQATGVVVLFGMTTDAASARMIAKSDPSGW